jgi:hypothetical protein
MQCAWKPNGYACSSGIAVLVMGGLLFQASNGLAQTPTFDPAKVLKGLQIAPVPLNMVGKDTDSTGRSAADVSTVNCHGN